MEQIAEFTGERTWIPHSLVKAEFSGDSDVLSNAVLRCRVELDGAKQPNAFNIDLNLSQGKYTL